MENIFEAYIASRFVRILDKRIYEIAVQDRKYHLFDWPAAHFLIKPDIVIRNKKNGEIFILDTKWKLLRRDKINYGISQSDMYQMYAYQKKYGAQNVRLIYPMVDSTFADKKITYLSKDGVSVIIEFIDLFHTNECLREIANNLNYQVIA